MLLHIPPASWFLASCMRKTRGGVCSTSVSKVCWYVRNWKDRCCFVYIFILFYSIVGTYDSYLNSQAMFVMWVLVLLFLSNFSHGQVPESAASWEELISSNGIKFTARNGTLEFFPHKVLILSLTLFLIICMFM